MFPGLNPNASSRAICACLGDNIASACTELSRGTRVAPSAVATGSFSGTNAMPDAGSPAHVTRAVIVVARNLCPVRVTSWRGLPTRGDLSA